MDIYLYKARKIGTKEIIKSEGKFESKDHANKHLINHQMVPLLVRKKTTLTSDLSDFSFFQRKIKTQDIIIFCKQFSVMVKAGISIGGSLHILGEQTLNVRLKQKVKEIDYDVQKGSSLSDAMAKHNEFPSLLISMIRSGEATGMMDQVMDKMASHYEKKLHVKEGLKKALTYPALVLIAITIIVPIIMIFVVPGFVDIFEDSELVLPIATQIVIAVSEWMQTNWIIMVVGMGVTVIGLFLFQKSEKGKNVFDQIALSLPLVGDLNKKEISALFSETLALLIASGIPVFQSLEIVKGVLSNSVAIKEMNRTLNDVKKGRTIFSSLETSKIYPSMMVNMLRIGEETGALEEMLEKTADYYNAEVEMAVGQLTVLIEPTLMLIIAFIVGGIMIAVILPTFTMATELM